MTTGEIGVKRCYCACAVLSACLDVLGGCCAFHLLLVWEGTVDGCWRIIVVNGANR